MTSPLVSVVLSVRDGERDLPRALDSILQQTFSDFELIAINDGSRDGTSAILDAAVDPRLRVVHQDGMGLARALNRGIAMARGRYIARQDHDDIALPTRLEKQAEFLEANPACALLGTCAEVWSGDLPAGRAYDFPADNAALQFELLFYNPFVHSSVMLRKAAVDEVGGYCTDPARQPPEDYELWSRLARRYEIANLPERLTIYRELPHSLSRTSENPFQKRVAFFCAENLAAATGEGQPGRHHLDIAGLIHQTYDRVSRRPNLGAMSAIISGAGERIAACAPASDVPQRVAAQIQNLRHALGNFRRSRSSVRRFLHDVRRSPSAQWIKRQLIPSKL